MYTTDENSVRSVGPTRVLTSKGEHLFLTRLVPLRETRKIFVSIRGYE